MSMYKRTFTSILCLLSFFSWSQANTNKHLIRMPVYPQIGLECPDFVFSNVHYFSKKEVSLSDFSGKWLVLDFWNKYCGSCIAAFPNNNRLQNEFSKDVQFLLIGYNGSDPQTKYQGGSIQILYEKLKSKLDLNLPIVYDSIVAQKFDIYTGPYMIIIDPKGIVRAITPELNRSNLVDLLRNKHPVLRNAYRMNEINKDFEYDISTPFLTNQNGGKDTSFLFRSLLSAWTPGMLMYSDESFTSRNGIFEQLNVDLTTLFRYAIFGVSQHLRPNDSLYTEFWDSPVLELKNSSLFTSNPINGMNRFCYSLKVPIYKSDRQSMMNILKSDLETYFGYTVSIQKRIMPVYRIFATEQAKQKLKTTGPADADFYINVVPHFGYKAKDISVKTLIDRISTECLPASQGVIIDDTGMTSNIDIDLNCLMKDFADVKAELERNGLRLLLSEKPMNVIVISEKKL